MTTYVAFLRAINVAGHAVVKMTDLRDAFRAAGCREVRSLIQSGNVVFESPAKTPTALVRRIQVELRRLLGEEPGLFLRTMRDIERLVEGNPFRRFAGKPRIKLYVAFLSRRLPPRQQPRLPLRSAPEALEVIAVKDREAFIVSGRKKNGFYGFPNAFIEQQLGVSATSRNWSTIKKIAPLLLATTLGCASAPPPEPRRAPPPPRSVSTTALDDMLRGDLAEDHAFPWSATRLLKWSDFQGPPPTEGSEGAKTSYTLYSVWRCRGATFEYRVIAGFRPRQSWVKAVVLNDSAQRRTVLGHEQTHFDLAEVHARIMRRAFRDLAGPCRKPDGDLAALAQRVAREEKAEQRRYDAETNHGLLARQQASWSLQTCRRLAASN